MKYKATNGFFTSMIIFKADVIVGPRRKRRFAKGLGFTLTSNSEYSSAGIYFNLRKAKLIQKRLGRVIEEIERATKK